MLTHGTDPLENLHKTYHLGEVDVPVLRGISLSIDRGEMVALMGASGSGKTTLMNILGCLDRPSSGKYWFDGEEMSRLTPNQRALVRTEKLGFVFQSFNLLARTTRPAKRLMPLDYSPQRPSSGEARRLARILLERVGLADRTEHEPSQMSGGQQQRVAIARSLVNHPALVLADEPTGNLDSHTSVEILRMFQQLNAEGITVILVTHDPKVAAYAHRTIRIVDGLIEGDEAAALTGRRAAAATAAIRPLQPAVAAAAGGKGRSLYRRRRAPKPRSASPACRLLPPTFVTALSALRRNKMRSALTALGVIIAVGAVIAMMEIGQGSKAGLAEDDRQHGGQHPPGAVRARPPAAASVSAPAAR